MKERIIRFINKIVYIVLAVLLLSTAVGLSMPSAVAFGDGEEASSGEQISEELKVCFFPTTSETGLTTQSGDCCIIEIGDVQILIDAGASAGSAKDINSRMDEFLDQSDEVFDYVIATHADSDHIAAFSTSENENADDGVLKYITTHNVRDSAKGTRRKIGTLIDFDITHDKNVKFKNKSSYFRSESSGDYTAAYKNYSARRNDYVDKGYIQNYYTASALTAGGVSKEFSLGSTGATLTILYNYYYSHSIWEADIVISGAAANVISVCVLITYGEQKLLFTGDLEEYDSNNNYEEIGGEGNGGETLLYENNKELLRDGVTFYKAAHHGSRTSNSADFIDKIRPQYIVIPAVAGSRYHASSEEENRFPAQSVLDNFLKYTDYIYIPSYAEYSSESSAVEEESTNGAKKYYGDITITFSGEKATVETEQLNACAITETEWFKNNRTAPLYTHIFDGCISEDEGNMGACTLIKQGNTEILVDCGVQSEYGSVSTLTTTSLVDEIKEWCYDGVIEWVVVTTSKLYSIQQLIDMKTDGDGQNEEYPHGILRSFEIENILDFGDIPDPSPTANKSAYKQYNVQLKELTAGGTAHYKAKDQVNGDLYVTDDLYIDVLNNKNYGNVLDGGVCVIIRYYGKGMLFTGDISADAEEKLVKNNVGSFDDIVLYKASFFGWSGANSQTLLDAIKNDDLHIAIASIPGERFYGYVLLSKSLCNDFINCTSETYLTAMKSNGEYKDVCGDLTFAVKQPKSGEFEYSMNGSTSNKKLSSSDYYNGLF